MVRDVCTITRSVSLQVMERLRTLFTGYAEYPPYCFVLCGNFLSVPPSSKQAKLFKGMVVWTTVKCLSKKDSALNATYQ